jgi:predicted AlkP superfamily pyrophosphatase or phosphodiesterase
MLRSLSGKLSLLALCLLFLTHHPASAQKRKNKSAKEQAPTGIERPKLVVGIVVDQMRYDFLYRYWDKYSEGGFKKLMREGYNCRNVHYTFFPTYTGPGHASIYTGSTPAVNGIVANDWYNRETKKNQYCTEDKTVQAVGSNSPAGMMSPRTMLTTTVGDELKLATNQKSKVIGICQKDRGSILPAGHSANAAYWLDGSNGAWITSTFYLKDLPQWAKEFNAKGLTDQYLNQTWSPLLPLAQYTESTADDVPWEWLYTGAAKSAFPYDLKQLRGKDFNLIRSTPWGNTLTKDFALAALDGEQLGKGPVTDFMAVSFSSTDYVGHQFGPNAVETEDTYLRLDKDLAELITALETRLGKENILVFLTADHGAAHVPEYLKTLRIPGGAVGNVAPGDSVKAFLNRVYGKADWVSAYENQQVYLNHPLIRQKKLNLTEMQQRIADYVQFFNGVTRAVTASNMMQSQWHNGLVSFLQQGHYPKRSGDVYLVLEPGWFEAYYEKLLHQGTTHGTPSPYDTHVPLLWYGWHIPAGSSAEPLKVTDIAPTLSDLLRIQEPSGCLGEPIKAIVEKR